MHGTVRRLARKRQEGITTNPRFKMKMYAVGFGIGAGNHEYAKEYAESLTQARASGVGIYRNAYQEIKPVLARERVPSALWGLYKAFANELISKVQRRGIATIDQIVDKWTVLGLDSGVLRAVVNVLVEVVTPEAPVPAQKPS
jgi:hypothetical protein